MAGDNTIPIPGWECAPLQPTSLFAKPGHIPLPVSSRHSHKRNIDLERWNFHADTRLDVQFARPIIKVSDHIGLETGRGQAPQRGSPPAGAGRRDLLFSGVGHISIVIQIRINGRPVINRVRAIAYVQVETDRDLIVRVRRGGRSRIGPQRPCPNDAPAREAACGTFIVA